LARQYVRSASWLTRSLLIAVRVIVIPGKFPEIAPVMHLTAI
jgi:hypothetical protein